MGERAESREREKGQPEKMALCLVTERAATPVSLFVYVRFGVSAISLFFSRRCVCYIGLDLLATLHLRDLMVVFGEA